MYFSFKRENNLVEDRCRWLLLVFTLMVNIVFDWAAFQLIPDPKYGAVGVIKIMEEDINKYFLFLLAAA